MESKKPSKEFHIEEGLDEMEPHMEDYDDLEDYGDVDALMPTGYDAGGNVEVLAHVNGQEGYIYISRELWEEIGRQVGWVP